MSTTRSLVFCLVVATFGGIGCSGGGGGGGGAGVAANNPPAIAASIVIETDEDTALSIDLKSFVSDPDGDTISIGSIVVLPGNGGLSPLTAAGTVTYTPNPDFNGNDTFRFRANDGRGGEVEGLVSLTIRPVNDPPRIPVATASVSTPEDVAIAIDLATLVVDADGDPIQIDSIVTPPTSGSLSAIAGTSVTYTPAADQNGMDSFRFRASDGQGGQAEGDVMLTIQPVNDAPVAQTGVSVTTPEDTELAIDLGPLVSDVDGDPIQIDSIVLAPALGSLGPIVGTSVTYTPAPDQNGVDVFRYRAIDGQGGQVEGEISITIEPVNDDPVAVDDTASTLDGVAVTIEVLLNDSDAELDSLTIVSVTVPTLGAAMIAPSGSAIDYTPPTGLCGDDQFSYTIEDGNGGMATAQVTVTVICADFEVSGTPIQDSYDITQPNPVVTTTISIRELPSSTGFPNDVVSLSLVIEHDPTILEVLSATPSPALAALNGGAGPDLFDAAASAPGVLTVTVTLGATPVVPSMGIDLFRVDYQPVASVAMGDPAGLSTSLSWGPSSVEIPLGTVPLTTIDIPVEMTPAALPSPDFFYLTPGARIVYDSLLGTANHSQSIYMQEGPGSAMFPRSIDGFSLGLAEDTSLLTPTTVDLGVDTQALNGGAGPDFFAANVIPTGGITAAAVFSIQFLEALPAPQAREILVVDYETVTANLAGNTIGATTSLMFVSTLGIPPMPPVNNLVVVGPVGFVPLFVEGSIVLTPSPTAP